MQLNNFQNFAGKRFKIIFDFQVKLIFYSNSLLNLGKDLKILQKVVSIDFLNHFQLNFRLILKSHFLITFSFLFFLLVRLLQSIKMYFHLDRFRFMCVHSQIQNCLNHGNLNDLVYRYLKVYKLDSHSSIHLSFLMFHYELFIISH